MIIVLRILKGLISLVSWGCFRLVRIRWLILMPQLIIWKTSRIICRFWIWQAISSYWAAIRVIMDTSIRLFIGWRSLNTWITFWSMIPWGRKPRRIVKISRMLMIRRMQRRTMKMPLRTPFLLRRILIVPIECLISCTQGTLMDRNCANFSNMRTFGQLSRLMSTRK